MNGDWSQLIKQLRASLDDLQTVQADIVDAQNRISGQEPDNFARHAVGSILHSFYQGMEGICLLIIKAIDKNRPAGGNWHRELLNLANQPLSGVRPAIIQATTAEQMESYLGFRHIFRNIYAFELDWQKMKPLLAGAVPLLEAFAADIEQFATFLQMNATDL